MREYVQGRSTRRDLELALTVVMMVIVQGVVVRTVSTSRLTFARHHDIVVSVVVSRCILMKAHIRGQYEFVVALSCMVGEKSDRNSRWHADLGLCHDIRDLSEVDACIEKPCERHA